MSSSDSHDAHGYPKDKKLRDSVDTAPHVDEVANPKRRQIGLFSAVFIIFNRIIGTGYVSTKLLQADRELNSMPSSVCSRHRVAFWV